MSGGHFNYAQHHINDIAEALANDLRVERTPDELLGPDEYKRGYSQEVMEELDDCLYHLEWSAICAHRVDYLFSGDDGEESFLKRLRKELDDLERRICDRSNLA